MEFPSPPRDSRPFFGRASLLAAIDDFVRGDADAPLVICGAAGSGKTALVERLRAVYEEGDFGDGRDSLREVVPRSDPPPIQDSESTSPRPRSPPRTPPRRRRVAVVAYEESSDFSAAAAAALYSSSPSPLSSPLSSPPTSTQPSSLSSPSLPRTPTRGARGRCLTIVNGLVFPSSTDSLQSSSCDVETMEGILRKILDFLDFPFSESVVKSCSNLPALTREALSLDYPRRHLLILDGIEFVRGNGSPAAAFSWLPLKLGQNVRVILTLSRAAASRRFLRDLETRETKPRLMDLPPLDAPDVHAFLRSRLRRKVIGGRPLETVAAKADAGNPLWLFLCLLELANLDPWSNVFRAVEKMEGTLDGRLRQILLKFPFIKTNVRCRKVDCENFKDLVIAAMCLIAMSKKGLYENELSELLCDKDRLLPPSEHVEKGEEERSEKESARIPRALPRQVWGAVVDTLSPLLQPSSAPLLPRPSTWPPTLQHRQQRCRRGSVDSAQSSPRLLRFHHPVILEAVKRAFLQAGEETDDSKPSSTNPEFYRLSLWWRTKLAKYFAGVEDPRRRAEELPHHLMAIGDCDSLADYLSEWSTLETFDLEDDEGLLRLWESAGGHEAMSERYRQKLKQCEDECSDGAIFSDDLLRVHDAMPPTLQRDEIMRRYERVANLLMTAGCYMPGIEMTMHAIEVETNDLDARPTRLASLYDLASKGYTEYVKMYDFASDEQLPHIQKAIRFGHKAIELRRRILDSMDNDEVDGDVDDTLDAVILHRHRLGLSLMNLAFNLDSWDACGGDNELSGRDARQQGIGRIDEALRIFERFKDDARKAEALMTKGILSTRGSSKQQKLYNEAMELSKLTFGKYHALTCRLYINIGILHEDNRDYRKAYSYFKEWSDICERVYGKKHPKTIRAYRVLKEPRYQRMAALESGIGGLVTRVIRSAAESLAGDSNRFYEEYHSIPEAEYAGDDDDDEGLPHDWVEIESCSSCSSPRSPARARASVTGRPGGEDETRNYGDDDDDEDGYCNDADLSDLDEGEEDEDEEEDEDHDEDDDDNLAATDWPSCDVDFLTLSIEELLDRGIATRVPHGGEGSDGRCAANDV